MAEVSQVSQPQGASQETPRHITVFCRREKEHRKALRERTRVGLDFHSLCSQPRVTYEFTKWFMERGGLSQYSRAIGLLKSIELRGDLNRDKSVRQEAQS